MLLVQVFEVFNNIADGGKAADVIILNDDSEFVLTKHNQIGKLNGVDTEVVGKLCVQGNVLTVDLKLFYEQICKFIKHDVSHFLFGFGFHSIDYNLSFLTCQVPI